MAMKGDKGKYPPLNNNRHYCVSKDLLKLHNMKIKLNADCKL
jgi:hypothetical protein